MRLSCAIAVFACVLVWERGATAQDTLPANWAFHYKQDPLGDDALLDLRSMNEKVAGEHGFVAASQDGESFITAADGTPIRFWAVGDSGFNLPPEKMDDHARFLAKIGVNMVRLHTDLSPPHGKLTDVNEKTIDRIWRFVAACKKQGIYVTISPYWANTKDASQWGIEGYQDKTDLWGLLFFNERLQEGYKAWVKALYARANPYTGVSLANDPAVAIIQVQNEDGLFFWTAQGLKGPQKKILGQKFAAWAAAKYGSLDKAMAAWNNTSEKGDDLPGKTLGLSLIWKWSREAPPAIDGRANRLADQLQFFVELQRSFYAGMVRFYRETLGCKQLINASNWITADPVLLNDAERYTNTPADVMAVNRYHAGLHTGKNNGWRVDPGDTFTNLSAVIAPRTLPTNIVQPAGHPFVITESSWTWPNGAQYEAPFLVAAYQSVSGIDAYYWFSTGEDQFQNDPYVEFVNTPNGHPMWKWSVATPQTFGNFPAAAIVYRRGDLTTPGPAVTIARPLPAIYHRQTPPIVEDANFDPNRNAGKTGNAQSQGGTIDPLAFLVGPVKVKYGGDSDKSDFVDLTKYIDPQAKIIRSASDQVKMDFGRGVCTIDSPNAQGAAGLLSRAGEIKLADVALQCHTDEASVLVVAMDGQPLAGSQSILVQVGTKVRPTGWKTDPAEQPGDNTTVYKILNTGKLPWLVTQADLTVRIRNAAISKATALDAGGYPAGDVPIHRDGAWIRFPFPAATMHVVLRR